MQSRLPYTAPRQFLWLSPKLYPYPNFVILDMPTIQHNAK